MPNLHLLPPEDRQVADDEVLIRNIHFSHVMDDGGIKSAAFRDDCLSMNRERLLQPIHDHRVVHPNVGGARLHARDGSAFGAGVEADPDIEVIPPNLAHALMTTAARNKALDRYARALRDLVMQSWDMTSAIDLRVLAEQRTATESEASGG